MKALRRQASKLRHQVVIKPFGASGYDSYDVTVTDEVELQRHQHLEKLYRSTRAARDLQKDIVQAAEELITLEHKHIEIGAKLSEDCYLYGGDPHACDMILAKAAVLYGAALRGVEKEHEDLTTFLSSEIIEPLRAMATGAALEDARGLAQRYSRMRHEAEALAADVSKRESRVRESPVPDNTAKLQASNAKMQEFTESMTVLGKEADIALSAVQSQQQSLSVQRLVAMVEAEKSYHIRIAAILDDFEAEMVTRKQQTNSVPYPASSYKHTEKALYFLVEATYRFDATSGNELSLEVGDYVVVRQVTPSGWSEGECRGKAGWFPSAYAEKRDSIQGLMTEPTLKTKASINKS